MFALYSICKLWYVPYCDRMSCNMNCVIVQLIMAPCDARVVQRGGSFGPRGCGDKQRGGSFGPVVAEEVATEFVPSSECIESHMTARGCWPDEAWVLRFEVAARWYVGPIRWS